MAVKKTPSTPSDRFLGKYVIVRSHLAGVFGGTLESRRGNWVTLANSRRLWRWQAAESFTLSGVAEHGIDPKRSNVAASVRLVEVEPCELMLASKIARKTIEEAPDGKQ